MKKSLLNNVSLPLSILSGIYIVFGGINSLETLQNRQDECAALQKIYDKDIASLKQLEVVVDIKDSPFKQYKTDLVAETARINNQMKKDKNLEATTWGLVIFGSLLASTGAISAIQATRRVLKNRQGNSLAQKDASHTR